MDARTISEKLLAAGEAITQARDLIRAEMEGLKSQVVAAVIDSKKARKLGGYGQELRNAAEAVANLDTTLSQLERTYLVVNGVGGAKKKVVRKGGAAVARKAKPSTPDAPAVSAVKVKRPRVAPGTAMELVWGQVQAKASSEWTALPRADIAKQAGVSMASVNAALKKAVADGKLQRQGREYKLT